MYVGSISPYNSSVKQVVTGLLDYVPTDNIGNNPSVEVVTSVLDYIVLQNIGYHTGVNEINTGILDYVPGDVWSYDQGVIQFNTGILEYLIDDLPFDIIITQDRDWTFNWELITQLWETIDNNFED
tara:strand:- start:1160 stop:1537 length:378 start_codon:yes stop_codon:yes gene_type:complete